MSKYVLLTQDIIVNLEDIAYVESEYDSTFTNRIAVNVVMKNGKEFSLHGSNDKIFQVITSLPLTISCLV